MSRTVGILLVLVAVAGLGCEEPASSRDPTTAITPLRLPDVLLERAPGRAETLDSGGGLILLHFWATWCAPCRRELPALLEAGRAERGVTVVAVSEESWEDLTAYFDGRVPPPIVRDASRRLSHVLGVNTLPETYVVDDDLVARRRAAGPVDWGDADVRFWLSEIGSASP